MDKYLEMHERWMAEALGLAEKALNAGEFPVGCVLVGNERVIARGNRINSSGSLQNELDHAEIVALRNWFDAGRPGGEITCYCTLEPCLMCTGALIISGVKRIVFAYEDVMGGACGMEFRGPFSLLGKNMAEKCLYTTSEIEVIGGVLRKESIRLFKSFFSNPQSNYLKNTLLERYTLHEV